MILRERISAKAIAYLRTSPSSLEHKENTRASRYILCTAPQGAQAGAEREEAAAWAVSKSRLNVGPPKKEPRAVHSRGLQLALFDTLLSRRRRGTGVSRRKGLLAMGKLPDPARAIRDGQHILELLIACWQRFCAGH
jgi:hypothetical protein